MAQLRRKHGPERPARVAQRRSQHTLMELVQRGKRRRRQRQPPESVPPLREPRLARLRLQKSQRVQKRPRPATATGVKRPGKRYYEEILRICSCRCDIILKEL